MSTLKITVSLDLGNNTVFRLYGPISEDDLRSLKAAHIKSVKIEADVPAEWTDRVTLHEIVT